MNERILELADEARIKFSSHWAHEGVDTAVITRRDLKEFAELIVRECNYLIQQQVSLKYKDGWEQSGISDDWACGHYAASILSRTVIKQHFGVKE
jgi:hypothetical protein